MSWSGTDPIFIGFSKTVLLLYEIDTAEWKHRFEIVNSWQVRGFGATMASNYTPVAVDGGTIGNIRGNKQNNGGLWYVTWDEATLDPLPSATEPYYDGFAGAEDDMSASWPGVTNAPIWVGRDKPIQALYFTDTSEFKHRHRIMDSYCLYGYDGESAAAYRPRIPTGSIIYNIRGQRLDDADLWQVTWVEETSDPLPTASPSWHAGYQ